MNKKGFTLVELLAVIVIMAVIATIGTVSMGAIRKKANEKMMEAKIPIILEAAKDWKKANSDPSDDNAVLVRTLINEDYLESEGKIILDNGCKVDAVINPVNNESLRMLKVCFEQENNRLYACVATTEWNGDYLDDPEFEKDYYYCDSDVTCDMVDGSDPDC